MSYPCDICSKELHNGYSKIIGGDYGICDSLECEKKAKQKKTADLYEHIDSGRVDLALECCGDECPSLYL